MELKVWVEGIQRIICGVSEQTTCQDVVVALAHATGKTGRFVLVERWRDNEKLMSPAESPARALSKWGEYAAEVQFILRKSDSQSRPPSVQHGYLSAMPDFYGDSGGGGGGGGGGRGVRKMATFSGA
ncbi:PREDICTED: ras association domain-containing protein 8-like, partial [Priapulus caudatus]|uniref:Ras association domain-containing protein 8-like n=1 Tax=Priapulus caudatus TaxID=37621 RepID=A0ABM1EYT4_PRICU